MNYKLMACTLLLGSFSSQSYAMLGKKLTPAKRPAIKMEEGAVEEFETTSFSFFGKKIEYEKLASLMSTFPSLSKLNLANGQLGFDSMRTEEMMLIINNLIHANNVKVLNLSSNGLKAESFESIAQCENFHLLSALDVSGNQLRNYGAEIIAQFLVHPDSKIEELSLNACDLSAQAIAILATALASSKIKTLVLDGNQINGVGAKALGLALPNSQIETLSLAQSFLDVGTSMLDLAGGILKSKIRYLNLQRSGLFDKSVIQLLINILIDSPIEYLDLSSNMIGKESGIVICGLIQRGCKLQELDLRNNYESLKLVTGEIRQAWADAGKNPAKLYLSK